MKCKFCARKAIGGSCRWPVRKFVSATYSDVQVGDTVRRKSTALDHRPPATIHDIFPLQNDWMQITLAIPVGGKGRQRFKKITVCGDSPLRREIFTYCNADTCEHHHREPAPGRTICIDHWRAWEQVA